MELGIMRVSGAAGVLARAAEKLGVEVPVVDEARLHRVAKAIGDAVYGYVDPIDTPNTWATALSAAHDALVAADAP